MTEFILKALMGASIGLTFVTLGFMAPRGAGLTSTVSPGKVQAQPGASPTGARGPRYVFVGGYYGGK